jgi:hypothetical protein
LESFSIEKANLSQYTFSVTPRSSIKAVLSSTFKKLRCLRIGKTGLRAKRKKTLTCTEKAYLACTKSLVRIGD